MSDNKERFAFGENWQAFSKRLTQDDYLAAKRSLHELVDDLNGKTFLDIGCGSGLFSAAASALGAKCVLGFDIDSQSVQTSGVVLEKAVEWDPSIKKDSVDFKVESILNHSMQSNKYDVVYSWGVLHHTGNMYAAFDAVTKMVADKGLLVIAIYNKHFTSPIWKGIKYIYNKSTRIIRKFLVYLVLVPKFIAALLIQRENPLKRGRGMHYYNDIVDWVGGYPYEYASVEEVTNFFESRGFKLRKLLRTKGFTGCNQYVFEKVI